MRLIVLYIVLVTFSVYIIVSTFNKLKINPIVENKIIHTNLSQDQDITITYICHGRPEKLRASVDSAKIFYPDVSIVVVDDGEHDYSSIFTDIRYYKLRHDVGPSVMRNSVAKLVQTEYMFITDDDIMFTESANLEKMKSILNSEKNIKMVTAGLDDRGIYSAIITPVFENGKKHEVCEDKRFLKHYNKNCVYSHRGLDIIFTTTRFFTSNPWDETNSGFAEHTTHFVNIQIRAKMNDDIADIVSCSDIIFHHNNGNNSEQYKKDRSRGNNRELEWYNGCKLAKKTHKRYNLLITGCGYSSTGFFSRVLSEAGYSIGHERLGENGMSAWFAASKKFPMDISLFNHIVALVRSPLKIVRSWRGTKWNFYHKTVFDYNINLSNEVTITKDEWDQIGDEYKVLEWWYSYTKMSIDISEKVIIVENITEVELLDVCLIAELPNCEKKDFKKYIKNIVGYNSHKKNSSSITWEELENNTKNHYEMMIIEKCRAFVNYLGI